MPDGSANSPSLLPAAPPSIPKAMRGGGRQTLREVLLLSALWGSAVLVVAGVLLVALFPDDAGLAGLGRTAEAIGLLAATAAVAASWDTASLRHLRAERSGGRDYDVLRGQRGLRVAAILLQLLEIFAAIVLLIHLADALGLVDLQIDPDVVANGVRILMAALALSAAAALSRSLAIPTQRPRSLVASILAGLALGGAGILAIAAAATALDRTGSLDAWIRLDPTNTGLVALTGFTLLAFALVRLRSLPTLTYLVYEDRGQDRGRALGASKASAVLIPAILAFALLLVVFLLFLLFGIGVGDLLVTVGNSPLLLAVLGFLLVALLASLAIAFTLARTARSDKALYQVLPDSEVRRVRLIIGGSAVSAAVLLLLAALSFAGTLPHGAWLHLLCLGLLAGLGPYGFYAAREHNRIRRLEERFPDFLRDIASSHKGGLTLHQAASIAARGEYGDLTPEVRKMADQLSWNVSFAEALERFAERVQTPLVQRAVSLILQADRSGGATTDVLLAAARDAREIKNLENERRTTMGLYTVVVYITFFVFLGVAAVLYAQFAPQIVASQQAVQSVGGNEDLEGLSGDTLGLEQYQLFYFVAAVVQGLGDGIVAGLLGSGRAALGLRHSFLMVLFSYVTFAFLL